MCDSRNGILIRLLIRIKPHSEERSIQKINTKINKSLCLSVEVLSTAVLIVETEISKQML